MKQKLLILPIILLLAGGCTTYQQEKSVSNPQQQNVTTQQKFDHSNDAKIDAVVNGVLESITAEDSVQTESDVELINSDKSNINSYSEVVNENNY